MDAFKIAFGGDVDSKAFRAIFETALSMEFTSYDLHDRFLADELLEMAQQEGYIEIGCIPELSDYKRLVDVAIEHKLQFATTHVVDEHTAIIKVYRDGVLTDEINCDDELSDQIEDYSDLPYELDFFKLIGTMPKPLEWEVSFPIVIRGYSEQEVERERKRLMNDFKLWAYETL